MYISNDNSKYFFRTISILSQDNNYLCEKVKLTKWAVHLVWPADTKKKYCVCHKSKGFLVWLLQKNTADKVCGGKLVRKQEITYKKKPCITNFPVFPLVLGLIFFRVFWIMLQNIIKNVLSVNNKHRLLRFGQSNRQKSQPH